MQKLLQEFKDFAMKGNVIDMAVGILIGAAFGTIVTSLVQDVMMPPIGYVMNGVDFSQKAITLAPETAELDADGSPKLDDSKKPKMKAAVKISYGKFINALINFIIVAFCMFIVIKQMNRLKKQPPTAEPTTKTCPQCQSTISLKATRCAFCTSQLEEAGKKETPRS